jgi:hypothetical protein
VAKQQENFSQTSTKHVSLVVSGNAFPTWSGAGLSVQMAELYVELYRGAAAGLLQPKAGTKLENTTTPFSEFAQTFADLYGRTAAA